MSIAELGSLGEFIGSLAVLVTLVVLVVQVRGARTELSLQLTRNIKQHNNEAFHILTRDAAFAALHLRGQADFESLSEAEQLRWIAWLHTWITQTEDAWLARRRGIPDMDWVDSYVLGIALVLRSAGGQIVWPRMRSFFDAAFADAMDQCIAEESVTQQEAMLGQRAPSVD